MRYALASGLIGGILTVAGVAAYTALTPQATASVAPAHYDLDHDGVISILDLTLLAGYFTMPAEPCITEVDTIHYATPITSTDTDGNPILVEGRGYLDPTSPWLDAALAGTPIARCQ